MLTPAEELLAAVKEHATAGDDFAFRPLLPCVLFYVTGTDGIRVYLNRNVGLWQEQVFASGDGSGIYDHNSASSAVYSAFLRARGKQL